MNKVAVVFWSGTGNTEGMANLVVEGAKGAGAEVDVFSPGEFTPEKAEAYDRIAFGCPAMGDEVLEEGEFEPMFEAVEGNLSSKRVAIFGSYSWADGQWMREWEERCRNQGISLVVPPVMCFEYPEGDGEEECKNIGAALAK